MKSKVHPKYKTKYHVRNWASYEQGLIRRGDVTIWLSPEAIAGWKAEGMGRPGGQRQYSAAAIETALTLRLIFHLPLRQAEGFVRSVFTMMGEGEWTIAKHGGHGKRRWRKLHLGVDGSGVIMAQAVTGDEVRDATTGLDLIHAVDGHVAKVTADGGYDTIAVYDAAGARGATVIVPPKETANVDRRGRGSSIRARTVEAVKRLGRRRWKKEVGYHQQARVENTFFRYKTILGGALRARHPNGQAAEAVVACNILNRMTELGKPESSAIDR